jgi:hypothetical protein
MDMIHPDLVFIYCEVQDELREALLLVNHLSLKYKDLTIGLGGKAVTTMKPSNNNQYSSFIFGRTINDWEMWLLDRMVF